MAKGGLWLGQGCEEEQDRDVPKGEHSRTYFGRHFIATGLK